MQQQVNFYQVQFRERITPLPTTLLLQACAAMFVAMLLIFAFAANRVGGVESEVRIITAQEKAALKRLENLRGTIESVLGEKSWADRLEEASGQLEEREASLRLISGTRLGNTDGFSAHLESLARQGTDGLWLTHISLSAQGDRTWLQGESLRADLVPVYLQELADEDPFASQRFHRLNIDRDDEDSGDTVTFVVTSDNTMASSDLVRR